MVGSRPTPRIRGNADDEHTHELGQTSNGLPFFMPEVGMDKRLEDELVIDFKAETKRAPRRPVREPDWDNRAGVRTMAEVGTVDSMKAELIKILRNCIARLEGTEPRKAWEPRSTTYPYTTMGLALLRAITLLDTIADRLQKEKPTSK
jgi:hypothetical protein